MRKNHRFPRTSVLMGLVIASALFPGPDSYGQDSPAADVPKFETVTTHLYALDIQKVQLEKFIGRGERRRFPLWRDDLLVGALHGRTNGRGVFRVRRSGHRVQYVERIRLDLMVRDMAHMSDGRLAVLSDDEYVLFLSPSDEYCDEESRRNRNVYAIHCSSDTDSDTVDDANVTPNVGGPDGIPRPNGGDPLPADGTGAQLYARHCGSCHSLEAGEHDVGPSLAGVIGRRVGKVDGYYDFSRALQSLDFIWTRGDLERFLVNPNQFAHGTSMPATSISNTDARLIAGFIDNTAPRRGGIPRKTYRQK